MARSFSTPALINLFAVNGLDSTYEAVKLDIALHFKRFVSLNLEDLEATCDTYTRCLKSVTSNAATPSAAAATSLPPPPVPDHSAPAEEANWRAVQANLLKAADVCPLCIRPHPFTNCDKCLHAGYIVVHDPEKAKIDLKASRENRGRRRKPAASASAASVPSMPSTAYPSPSPAPSLTTQPPDDGEDASALVAAAVHVMEDGYDSLSDNEEGLLEHPGMV